MRRVSTSMALAVLLLSSTAAAGNSDEVNAGVDVTLTGGAVVASVSTGALTMNSKFYGAAAVGTKIVFAPCSADAVGVFDLPFDGVCDPG